MSSTHPGALADSAGRPGQSPRERDSRMADGPACPRRIRPPAFDRLGYLYGIGLATCYLSHYAFRRLKPAFADVL